MTGLLIVVILVATVAGATAVLRSPVVRDCPPRELPARPGVPQRVDLLGRLARRAIGRSNDAVADRSAGRVLLLIVGLLFLDIRVATIAGFVLWARSLLRRRRTSNREAARRHAGLADLIDLFAVSLLSGGTVGEATRQVSEWAEDDFAVAFAWCSSQAASGRLLSDALESLPARVGPEIRPLVAALVATERHGAPIAASLAQLAADTRSDRRRRAEAEIRKLPVALLFPLVGCVLPAFLLVTVVPVVLETLANFDVTASP